jgi:hypothetical protein
MLIFIRKKRSTKMLSLIDLSDKFEKLKEGLSSIIIALAGSRLKKSRPFPTLSFTSETSKEQYNGQALT